MRLTFLLMHGRNVKLLYWVCKYQEDVLLPFLPALPVRYGSRFLEEKKNHHVILIAKCASAKLSFIFWGDFYKVFLYAIVYHSCFPLWRENVLTSESVVMAVSLLSSPSRSSIIGLISYQLPHSLNEGCLLFLICCLPTTVSFIQASFPLSLCLSVCLSVCLCLCVSLCLSVCLSLSVCLCLSLCPVSYTHLTLPTMSPV